jgi:hypothetical protein
MLRPRSAKVDAGIGREHKAGKNPNLNHGLMAKDDFRKRWDLRIKAREDIKAAKKAGTAMPSPHYMDPMYSPIAVEIGVERGALFAFGGQQASKGGKSKPKGWNDNILGPHLPGMKLANFRLMHAEDIRKLVHTPDALVKVGKFEYVVATTGKDGISAAFLIDGSKTGNYAANHRAAKQLSYANLVDENGKPVSKTEFATVVGRINNDIVTETWENGHEISFFANQVVTWGHLVKGGKVLTPTQIRDLKDASGVSFKAVRWVGSFVERKPFWEVVKGSMSSDDTKNDAGKTAYARFSKRPRRSTDKAKQNKSKESDAWKNVSDTQTRCVPEKPFCYGLRYAAVGQAIGKHWSVKDGKVISTIFVCLGGHLTCGLTQLNQKWDANRELSPAKPAKVTKPKASKKDAKSKAAKRSPAKASKKDAKKGTKSTKTKTKAKSKSKKSKKAKPSKPKTSAKKSKEGKDKKSTTVATTVETPAPPTEPIPPTSPDLADTGLDDTSDLDEDAVAEAELDQEQRDRANSDAEAAFMSE